MHLEPIAEEQQSNTVTSQGIVAVRHSVDDGLAHRLLGVLGRLQALDPAQFDGTAHIAQSKGHGTADLLGQRPTDVFAHKPVAHALTGVAHGQNLAGPHPAIGLPAKEQHARHGRPGLGAVQAAALSQQFVNRQATGVADARQISGNRLTIEIIVRGPRERFGVVADLAARHQQLLERQAAEGCHTGPCPHQIASIHRIDVSQPGRYLHKHCLGRALFADKHRHGRHQCWLAHQQRIQGAL